MKKARTLDLSSTSTLTVRIQGVPVVVNLDANGWPCSARTSAWVGSEEERLRTLAAAHAIAMARAAAQAAEKDRSDAERTKKSTETKREKAAEHFSADWFSKIYEKNPKIGALQLARKARQLFAEQDPVDEARKEISEHRAKRYLQERRESGDM